MTPAENRNNSARAKFSWSEQKLFWHSGQETQRIESPEDDIQVKGWELLQDCEFARTLTTDYMAQAVTHFEISARSRQTSPTYYREVGWQIEQTAGSRLELTQTGQGPSAVCLGFRQIIRESETSETMNTQSRKVQVLRRRTKLAESGTAQVKDTVKGPWDAALETLRGWDPQFAQACFKMTTNPWTTGVLPLKLIELICVGINAACTNLNPGGTRRHIRSALDAGGSREEILTVLKMASVMAIHSCSLGAPILLEEAKAAGAQPTSKHKTATPAINKMKALGQWNDAWNPFLQVDSAWTDEFMATVAGIYAGGIFSAKDIELLSIAFDVSYTHMYTPGTWQHIKNAIRNGATMEEIMEVLKLSVAQGVQACNLAVPILEEELSRRVKVASRTTG